MRWPFFSLFLTLLGIVQALSTTGSRLLIIVEEAADKAKYSTFWGDLEGMYFNSAQIASDNARESSIVLINRVSQLAATVLSSRRQKTKNSRYSSMASANMTTSSYSLQNPKVCFPLQQWAVFLTI